MSDMRLLTTPCPSLSSTDLTNATLVELNGTFILYPNQTLNAGTSTQIVVRGGCVLLQGQLHLVVSPTMTGNETLPLITSEDGCLQGTFSQIQLDTSQNQHICKADPTYTTDSVFLQLEACPAEAVETPPFPIAAVVGGAVGGAVLIALVIILAVFLYKRGQEKQQAAHLDQKLAPTLDTGVSI